MDKKIKLNLEKVFEKLSNDMLIWTNEIIQL